MRTRLISVGVALVLVLAFAATASANDRFTLDAKASSPGHVVVDSAGTAYVAWTHEAGGSATDPVMFCEIPLGGTCTSPKTLPIPGAVDDVQDVSGAFPVLGSGSTVYVVGARYVEDDLVVWKSTDGGQTFDAGTAYPGGYSSKTDPSNVILDGTNFLIGAFNAGLGFGEQPVGGGTGSHFTFSAAGSVASGSFGLDGSGNPVSAYWELTGSQYPMFFYRYKGSGLRGMESNWEGPFEIGKGYETKLASGAGGLFLVSQDYPGAGGEPTALQVRKYAGTSFGAPVTLSNDSSVDLFDGGAIAESPSGHLDVAWPGVRSGDKAFVMRLFSSNDGVNFSETDIAHLGSAYGIGDNAQLAITDSGAGWLTYSDAGGLQMADTTPITPAEPEKQPTYKGKEKTTGTKVGGYELTLRLPQGCLEQNQPFYAGAGRRVRHKVAKSVHSKLTLKSATFTFDGKKLKTLKKKPLKLLIDPGTLPAGSVHTVKVKITAVTRGHGVKPKKVVRTLKGTITIC